MNRYTRVSLYTLFILACNIARAQQIDTVQIKEITIESASHTREPHHTFDSLTIKRYNTLSLSDLLSENTLMLIKNNGSGSLATSSIRGGTASQTNITWNGVNINAPTHGQIDFSLIPVSFVNKLRVKTRTDQQTAEEPAIGGTIALESSPQWMLGTRVGLQQSYGSFDLYKSSADITIGDSSFLSQTQFSYGTSTNDYTYRNTSLEGYPEQQVSNGKWQVTNIIQQLYKRWNNHVFSMHVWLEDADRRLPASMLSTFTKEREKDRLVRTIFGWDMKKGSYDISLRSAFIAERYVYSEANYQVNTDTKSSSFRNVLMANRSFNHGEIFSRLSWDHDQVLSDFYGDLNKRITTNFSSGFNYKLVPRLLFVAKGGAMVIKDIVYPQYSGSIDYSVFKKNIIDVYAAFQNQNHAPTLNDLFWTPGGNPDLKPERGTRSEIGTKINIINKSYFKTSVNVAYYNGRTKDLIQWVPSSFGYWMAQNVKDVDISGYELNLNAEIKIHQFKLSQQVNVNRCEATSENRGNEGQLIYIPLYSGTSVSSLKWKQLSVTYVHSVVSKRYITADNLTYLPWYGVATAYANYYFSFKKLGLTAGVRVNNLWDMSYQSVAYRPLPGRNFEFTLQCIIP